jgi:hypothetical protein
MKLALSFAALTPLMALFACGTAADRGYIDVGRDDPGSGGFVTGDGGGQGLDAYIEQGPVAVKLVTLSCSGECATVQAVGTGGAPPYTYAWEDGSTAPVRKVCPASNTAYSVEVTDSGETGELPKPPQTARASVTADVLACTDGGHGGGCVPGTYAGTWIGTGLLDGGDSQAPTSGQSSIALADSTNDGGDQLVTSGAFILTWDIAAQWTAHLSGGLDCTTGVFKAEDPMALTTVAGIAAGTCDMTVVGQYDPATATISGTWTSNCSGIDWAGTWTTQWTP